MNNPNESILLTEDGHPIGDLVVANEGGVVDTTPTSDAEAAAVRHELLRKTAMEMTGDPDADVALATLYESYTDEEKRRQAMVYFVTEHCSIAETAAKVGVPERTVSMWIYEGKWEDAAAKEVSVRQSSSILEMELLRTKNRTRVAQEQLNAAQKIRDITLAKLDKDQVSVKSAAEALKSAADVESRILGVSESGAINKSDQTEDTKAKENKKQPLVVIFQGGGLPPPRRI